METIKFIGKTIESIEKEMNITSNNEKLKMLERAK